jgi:hypothetical protein
MSKVVCIFFFALVPLIAYSQAAVFSIQEADSVFLSHSDLSIEVFQRAWAIEKNTFFSLAPQEFYASFLLLCKMLCDDLSFFSSISGHSLSFPPTNYLDILGECVASLAQANEYFLTQLAL